MVGQTDNFKEQLFVRVKICKKCVPKWFLCYHPNQGTELSPGIRKIRMAIKSKGGGKSGGARVITYNVLTKELDGDVYLLEIYDKSDASTVKMNVIKAMVESLGV